MKQNLKKGISLLLTLCMLLGLLPAAALGAETEGYQRDESIETFLLEEVKVAQEATDATHYTSDAVLEGVNGAAVELKGKLEIDAGVTVTLKSGIKVSDTLVVKGGGTLKRASTFTKGSMFAVPADTTLTIEGTVIIDGDSVLVSNTYGGAVYVAPKGTLNMTGGTIQNCRTNMAPGGAAVCVGGNNTPADNATFTMSGGTIKDNRFESQTQGVGGGGVAVLGTFEMSGTAMITNNYSGTNGGGIFLAGNNTGGQNAQITIEGGSIVGNTARRWGGGIEAIANRDCGGEANSILTITGGEITGNLSNYQNPKSNDGYGGGLETSDMGGTSKFYVGENAMITGNNHWTSAGYTQDNLYCGTSATSGMPILTSNFTGKIGVTPATSQSAGGIFGNADSKTAPAGSFFYDGKDLVNVVDTLTWGAPISGVVLKGVTISPKNGVYGATTDPVDAAVTYQWYASATDSVGGGLPIPKATAATYKPGPDMAGKYIYVIADGTGTTTRRATSNLLPVAPKLTGDYTLYFSTTDGKLHKNSLTGEALDMSYGYYATKKGSTYDTLVLNGFNFVSSKGGIQMPYNTNIELADGSMNSIESTSRTGSDWSDWGIHVGVQGQEANGTMTIKGSGTLSVKGACAAIMVHYSNLVIDGSAVIMAEGNGYPGNDARDSAGIYAMNGIIAQGNADVSAIGGPCAQNSYGAGSNKGGVTVKGNATLTVAGGQSRDTSGKYRSMGIATADKFTIEGKGDANVVARGNTVAVDIWYTTDSNKNNLNPEVMFAGNTIEHSKAMNGDGFSTTTSGYAEFAKHLDWKDAAVNGGTVYKWVRIYNNGSSAGGKLVNPAFSHASGSYSGAQTVTIAAPGSTSIFYTVDGTEPSKTNGIKYTDGVVLSNGDTTLKAIAYSATAESAVATATYTIIPAPKLTGLTIKAGGKDVVLAPSFKSGVYSYSIVVPADTTKILVTPSAGAPILVNDAKANSGTSVDVNVANIAIAVGSDAKSNYTITVKKAAADAVTKKDTYEPLTIISGFNKDVVVEKPGTPSSYAEAYDGVNAAAQFAFYTKAYNGTGGVLPDNGNMTDPNAGEYKTDVRWKLADYAGKNAIQLSWDSPKATVRFETLSTYDKLSLIGSSGNADGHFKVTIHYTDGTTSSATFTAPNWSYAPGKSLESLSRVKLLTGAGTTAGTRENGFAMYAFEIPVTPGKLVSYLDLVRTDTTTGDAAARTNVVAVSGVISKGTLLKPSKPDGGTVANGEFTAKWLANDSAAGYYIDVAATEDFSDMLPNYNNKKLQPGDYTDDGTNISYVVKGITGTVYYRVRSVGSDGKQSQSSEPAEVIGKGGNAGAAAGFALNKPSQTEAKTYTFPNAVVTDIAKTIVVGFADTINSGDYIELPNISGFTVSSGSNNYSKRITVSSGKTAADIQTYLQQIVFHLGEASFKTGKNVQVTLSNEASSSNDTFYNATNKHYYQFVPFARTDGSKTWVDCYNAAKGMTYAGRTGYLATVTSADEDMFIKSLSGQIGWLGGTQMFTGNESKVNVNGKVHADPTPGTPADTDALNLYFKTGDATHTGDANRSWRWACGPEIGLEISSNKGVSINNAYVNWNAGEPSGWAHNGKPVTNDQHECCMTTLFQGSKGFSWNDRAIAANVYGLGVTAGYQPYGYFVEYGDKTTGDTLGDAADGSTITVTEKIDASTPANAGGGSTAMNLSQMPEVKAPVSSDPNWKLVPGTSPAEYKYVGTAPANGDEEGWEWRYTEKDNSYALILNGVDTTTTNRPAINLPDYPTNDTNKPVYIKVMDGTNNTITNLEDADKTTDVTIIDSKRDLVLMPYGPQNDGTLTLVGSNDKDSEKGVYGIDSYGDVNVKSLDLTIKLTDNRSIPPYDGATTGIKSEGDIVLDNPKLDIEIIDNRPNIPGTGEPPTDPARPTPAAHGMEPGNPRNNVYINGGEVDVNFLPANATPAIKGDATYPSYRPVYVDNKPVIPDELEDEEGNPKDLFPIKPEKPGYTKDSAGNITVYANGSAILVKKNTAEPATTDIYYDADRSGTFTAGDELVHADTAKITAHQVVTIYAGAKDKASAGWPLVTVESGKVDFIYAGGFAESANANLTGSPIISIGNEEDVVGGTVKQVYDGGNNTTKGYTAKTIGVVTLNVSVGNVDFLTSRSNGKVLSQSVFVNLTGGTIGALNPNTDSPITLNISGAPTVKSLTNYQALAGGKVNIVEQLEAAARIFFQVSTANMTPGTIVATAADAKWVKGTYSLLDGTGAIAKGKQLIIDGVNVKIADGGPTVLQPLDLSQDIQIPTGTNPPGWTGPNADGRYEYNKDVPADGWVLEYQPVDKNNPTAHYVLILNKFNLEAEGNTGLTLPADAPTTVVIKGSENKITVRGTGDVTGIYAPKGVEFQGESAAKDILTVVADSSTTGIVTGVKSDEGITVKKATIKVNVLGQGQPGDPDATPNPIPAAPSIGMEADKGDVIISDGDVKIDIPNAAPAKGITAPEGNVEIKDTDPTDGRKPAVDIEIGGKKDQPSIGIEAGKDPATPGTGDIIIGGGDINVDIATGKPAIGIKAEDDVIVDKGDPALNDKGEETKPGEKPSIDVVVGDKKRPEIGGYPGIGIQAKDKDKTGEATKPGGIIIGGGGDITIDIPNAPGNYQPNNPVNPGDPDKDTEPNKGMDSKGDVIITEESDITIKVTGPGTGIKTEPGSPSKGDVIIKDSDLDITVKPDPKSDPDTKPKPNPAGPAIGVDAKGDIEIVDTKPNDDNKPNINIIVGDIDRPNAKGAPNIGLNTDPTPGDTGDGSKGGGDIIIGGVDLTIDIPNSKGAPNIGINSDKEVIIAPDPAKPIPGPSDPTSKPGDKNRPNIDITVGDPDEKYDPKDPTPGGPGTGIKGKEDIIIGGADLDINIPNIGPGSTYPNPAKYDPNKGIEGDENITIGDASDLVLDITGPGTGIKGKDDVVIESSDVDVIIKKDPDAPAQKDDPSTGDKDEREPTTGVEAGGKIEIKDTNPAHRRPGVSVDLEGDGPTKGLETEPGTGNDIIVGPGGKLDIKIDKGVPAIGVDSGDDVIIGTDPNAPDPAPGAPKPARPDINIQIGDKIDPGSGGQPGKGIVADKDITIGDTDVIVEVNTKPAPAPKDPTNPTDDETTTGLEAGGDVDIKGSDVVVEITDGTKPVPNSGPGTGILAGDNVTAEDSNLDVIVTGKPGTGIKPDNKDEGNGKVEIEGDTVLDIETKPSDPNVKPGQPVDPGVPDGDKWPDAPAVDGDLTVDTTAPSKPNIIIKGTPKNKPVVGDIKDDKGNVITLPAPDKDGNIIVVENKYVTAALKVPGTPDEYGVIKVKGTIDQAITDVTGVTVTLTEGATFTKGSDGKYAIKIGDKLVTNLSGVNAVVTAVNDTVLNLKLSGTPARNCGTAITVTVPTGAIKDVKIAVKVTDDAAHWAVALPAGTTVSRDESVDLLPDPNDPDKTITYIDENGEKKEKKLSDDITDNAEGWDWYPTKPGENPADPDYAKDPDNYIEDSDGNKYLRPAVILDNVDIKPADPTKPGFELPDNTIIVVEPGGDNVIEGAPAINVGGAPGKVVITGPGDLVIKGTPRAIGPAAPNAPAILVDPDVIVKEKGNPVTPVDTIPASDKKQLPPGDYTDLSFGHVSAVISNLKTNVTGKTGVEIKVENVKLVLQNASTKPGTLVPGIALDTNTSGIKAYVEDVSLDRSTVTVTIEGTVYQEVTGEKVKVTLPSQYVLENATLIATSEKTWAITVPEKPVDPTPTPPTGGSVTSDEKDKSVEIKKTVGNENGKKINIFEPDKKQLDQVINDLSKGDEIVIDLNKDRDADDVILKLKGDTLEKMAEKEINIKIIERDIVIEIPAKKLPVGPIINDMGKKPEDVDVNIRVYEPTDEEKEAIRKAIDTDGSTQTDEPISFEITVGSGSEKRPVDGFDGYVTVAFKITEEQANKITTAITWQKNGSLLHIPTYVFKESGQYYAKVNALVNCTTTLIFNQQNFVDTVGTWYNDVATELASRKIMNGVGNSKFEGGLNITRAEFAVIVARALGLPMDATGAEFTDVTSTDWYVGAAAATAKFGIINGNGEGKFLPMNQITRQEAMAIIARAAKVAEYTGSTGSVSSYPDSGALADWAKDAAAMTVGSGLIKGSEGQLRPTDTITRGETAVLILRLLQKADLVDVRSAT